MRALATLQDWLIWDESLSLVLYRDSKGNLTTGIGHNLTANGLPANVVASIPDGDWIKIQSQGLALSEALALYDYDVLQARIAYSGEGLLIGDPVREAAIINMMFNLGAGTFAKFTTFIPLVQAENWPHAAQDLRQNPKLFTGGLANRYNRIANTLESGAWPIIT